MGKVQASVIVPSYNSRTTIIRCLEGLENQTTTASFEIIVVDSSTDGTDELVRSRFPAVKLVHLPKQTLPGEARNLGIEKARGEILAFTDADCIPEPLWLYRMIRDHKKNVCVAVGGAVVNALPMNPVAWSGYLLEFSEQLPTYPKRFVQLLPTCNVSFRREIFDRYGLFPTNLWPSEDHIFSWRLVCAGEKLLFNPLIRVRHIFRPRLNLFLKHQLRLGKASASARKQADLPYAWLAVHRLRWLVPAVRLVRIESRLVRWDLMNFFRFNLLLPLCLSGLIAWGAGFCTRSPRTEL